MHIPLKKLKSGFSIPAYGLGTWQMGGRFERDLENNDVADTTAIRNSINEGVFHIDTAESYANGYTEILVGKVIRDFKREDIFLVSKVKKTNLKYDDVIRSCSQSLKRLGTSYLDLYLIHAPNPEIPLNETMRALDTLLSEGKVRNIGVSNFSNAQFEEAQSATKNKLVVNQVHYNLLVREIEDKGVLKYCQDNDVMLVAYRPLQKAELFKITVPDVVDTVCNKYEKTPNQVAINWLISQKNVVTISMTRDLAHLKENLGGIGWEMSATDVETLRNDYPNQQMVSDVVKIS